MTLSRSILVALGPCLLIAGCGNYSKSLDDEIVSSLAYDQIDCRRLMSDRSTLAARYGEPDENDPDRKPGARPKMLPVGMGTVLPDIRGESERERRKALGRIAAMDRSIERRQCATGG